MTTLEHNDVAVLPPGNYEIEQLEAHLLAMAQVEIPLTHKFAPGVYLREIFMPKGSFVIGHEHKTEYFNIVLSGRATVMIEGDVREIAAPCIFKSGVGVRKMAYIHEDMRWATVHPTDETDLEKLEEDLIVKSVAFENHEQMVAAMRSHLIKDAL